MDYIEIPENLQTDFLTETVSAAEPAIRREGGTLIFPAFVRQDGANYRYFEVTCIYRGQSLTDYAACALASYADLRRHFYGDWAVQMEQQLKGAFAAHQYAVKTAFPKVTGEMLAEVTAFETIKATFWTYIDTAAALVSKTRDDFPSGASADLMTYCSESGMSAAEVADFAIKILGITADLARYGRNWNELFE